MPQPVNPTFIVAQAPRNNVNLASMFIPALAEMGMGALGELINPNPQKELYKQQARMFQTNTDIATAQAMKPAIARDFRGAHNMGMEQPDEFQHAVDYYTQRGYGSDEARRLAALSGLSTEEAAVQNAQMAQMNRMNANLAQGPGLFDTQGQVNPQGFVPQSVEGAPVVAAPPETQQQVAKPGPGMGPGSVNTSGITPPTFPGVPVAGKEDQAIPPQPTQIDVEEIDYERVLNPQNPEDQKYVDGLVQKKLREDQATQARDPRSPHFRPAQTPEDALERVAPTPQTGQDMFRLKKSDLQTASLDKLNQISQTSARTAQVIQKLAQGKDVPESEIAKIGMTMEAVKRKEEELLANEGVLARHLEPLQGEINWQNLERMALLMDAQNGTPIQLLKETYGQEAVDAALKFGDELKAHPNGHTLARVLHFKNQMMPGMDMETRKVLMESGNKILNERINAMANKTTADSHSRSVDNQMTLGMAQLAENMRQFDQATKPLTEAQIGQIQAQTGLTRQQVVSMQEGDKRNWKLVEAQVDQWAAQTGIQRNSQVLDLLKIQTTAHMTEVENQARLAGFEIEKEKALLIASAQNMSSLTSQIAVKHRAMQELPQTVEGNAQRTILQGEITDLQGEYAKAQEFMIHAQKQTEEGKDPVSGLRNTLNQMKKPTVEDIMRSPEMVNLLRPDYITEVKNPDGTIGIKVNHPKTPEGNPLINKNGAVARMIGMQEYEAGKTAKTPEEFLKTPSTNPNVPGTIETIMGRDQAIAAYHADYLPSFRKGPAQTGEVTGGSYPVGPGGRTAKPGRTKGGGQGASWAGDQGNPNYDPDYIPEGYVGKFTPAGTNDVIYIRPGQSPEEAQREHYKGRPQMPKDAHITGPDKYPRTGGNSDWVVGEGEPGLLRRGVNYLRQSKGDPQPSPGPSPAPEAVQQGRANLTSEEWDRLNTAVKRGLLTQDELDMILEIRGAGMYRGGAPGDSGGSGGGGSMMQEFMDSRGGIPMSQESYNRSKMPPKNLRNISEEEYQNIMYNRSKLPPNPSKGMSDKEYKQHQDMILGWGKYKPKGRKK